MTLRVHRHLATAVAGVLIVFAPGVARADTPRGAIASGPTGAFGAPARPDTEPPGYTKADVSFVQGMIAHHAQALVMAGLVPSRTQLETMRLLAERIDVSQRDEIKIMERWLGQRGETVPGADAPMAHHGAHADTLMPGMLTGEELARLAAVSGTEFERLFLEFMIRHHEGALTMVARLFAVPGAAQDGWVFRFASDVDADQRAEIQRMRRMLDALPAEPTRP